MHTPEGRAAIVWSPRVRKDQIARLYRSDANGFYDESLIDDVGFALYLRCRDIVTVKLARGDKLVRCPVCDRRGTDTFIPRNGDRAELLRCPACGWEIVWEEYLRAVQRKQLNPGGALSAFRRFISTWERNPNAREKMLAIDRLIHEFHHSWHPDPTLPTRPAACNLIAGRMKDIVQFLDDLTACSPSVSDENTKRWRRELSALRAIDWPTLSAEERERKKAKRRESKGRE
jgi:hypothetical protein